MIGGDILPKDRGYRLISHDKQAREVLRKLPVKHDEKSAAKKLVLHYADNCRFTAASLEAYRYLRGRTEEEVERRMFVPYIGRHGRPHSKDPDQTVPDN